MIKTIHRTSDGTEFPCLAGADAWEIWLREFGEAVDAFDASYHVPAFKMGVGHIIREWERYCLSRPELRMRRRKVLEAIEG